MKAVCLLLSLLFLAGCVHDPLSAAHKAGFRTVLLEPSVESDNEMRYGVDVSQLGDLRSTASSDMMNDVGQDGLRRMQLVMKKHHIDVPQMIHDRMEEQLTNQPSITIAAQPPADGVFKAKIIQYGFNDMPFSLVHEIPFIVVQISLRDNHGHIVWSRLNGWSLPSNDDAGASWDEYEAHPDELRDEWNTQIDQAVDKLIPSPTR